MSPGNVVTKRACGAEIKQRGFATHMRSCEKCREEDTKNTNQENGLLVMLIRMQGTLSELQNELRTVKADQTRLQNELKTTTDHVTELKEELQQTNDELKAVKTAFIIPATGLADQKQPAGWTRNPLMQNLPHTNLTQVPPQRPVMHTPPRTQNCRQELIIRNIPYREDENIEEIVRAIATAKNINLNEDVKCFRAMSKTITTNFKNPPKIIITQLDPKIKNLLRRKPPVDRDEVRYTFPDEKMPSKIYIEENLTSQQSKLFFKTREKRKQLGYKFAWTRDGEIFLRADEYSDTYTIASERDLQQIIPENQPRRIQPPNRTTRPLPPPTDPLPKSPMDITHPPQTSPQTTPLHPDITHPILTTKLDNKEIPDNTLHSTTQIYTPYQINTTSFLNI